MQTNFANARFRPWLATAVAVALAAGLASCARPPEKVLGKAFEEAKAAFNRGDAAGAVRVLEKTYQDRRCEQFRPRLLSAIVSVHLSTGGVSAAESAFRAAASGDPALAASALGQIEEYRLRNAQPAELANWCATIEGYAFAEPALARVAGYHARALLQAGRTNEMFSVMSGYLPRLSEQNIFPTIRSGLSAALANQAWSQANQWIDLFEKNVKESPERQGRLAGLRTELLTAQGMVREADDAFRGQAREIPDGHAAGVFRQVAAAWEKAGEPRAAEELFTFALRELPDSPETRNAAAKAWVDAAEKQGSASAFLERLVALEDMGLPPSFLVQQVNRAYSMILKDATAADQSSLLAFSQELAGGDMPDHEKARLAEIALDMCFFLKRFDLALQILDKPIPGQDEEGRLMLQTKVRAHLALEEGRKRDAVAAFREFMGHIARSSADQIDPLDQTRITKEMILGLNAKRIGDILTSDGDPAAAAKAYREAREYYRKALGNFQEGTPERKKIDQELSAIAENVPEASTNTAD